MNIKTKLTFAISFVVTFVVMTLFASIAMPIVFTHNELVAELFGFYGGVAYKYMITALIVTIVFNVATFSRRKNEIASQF
ncbi:hypothetical protein L1D14_10465 [Vibrio tubiashii]|uniref:hypothetical protein n=1 Tax=Vibrio tubiashii TaxID=29498 RepID=UPI001EFC772D|nr:hypothetical protein [Vibrio tubiashii]MCG9576660.1 hypothetical protein [Vibrio tubiashii]